MTPNTKKALIGTLAVGSLAVLGVAVSAPQERVSPMLSRSAAQEVEAKIGRQSSKFTESPKEVQALMDGLLILIHRTADGEEVPTEEWDTLEQQVDDMRQIEDSPLLQRMDRVFETHDADPYWFNVEVQKLLAL